MCVCDEMYFAAFYLPRLHPTSPIVTVHFVDAAIASLHSLARLSHQLLKVSIPVAQQCSVTFSKIFDTTLVEMCIAGEGTPSSL